MRLFGAELWTEWVGAGAGLSSFKIHALSHCATSAQARLQLSVWMEKRNITPPWKQNTLANLCLLCVVMKEQGRQEKTTWKKFHFLLAGPSIKQAGAIFLNTKYRLAWWIHWCLQELLTFIRSTGQLIIHTDQCCLTEGAGEPHRCTACIAGYFSSCPWFLEFFLPSYWIDLC